MAKLPTREVLGGLPGRPSRQIASITVPGADATGLGLQKLGSDLSGLGAKLTEQHDQYEYSNAHADLMKKSVELDTSYSNDTDYATRPQRYSDDLDNFVKERSTQISNPQIRNRFLANAGVLHAQHIYKQTTIAQQMGNQDAVTKLQGEGEYFINSTSGHADETVRGSAIEGYKARVDALVSSRVMSPIQGAAATRKFVHDYNWARANNLIDKSRIDDGTLDGLENEVRTAPPLYGGAANPIASPISQTAQNLGIEPRVLAAAISYETGGTFDPNKRGGKGNNYLGLIQFGPEERNKYGVKPGMTVEEQMPAVEAYLRDRGVKPGMGVAEVYSIINAGSLGSNGQPRWNASDGNGTVRDHVGRIERDHIPVADSILAGGGDLPGTQDNTRPVNTFSHLTTIERQQLLTKIETAKRSQLIDMERANTIAQREAKRVSDDEEGLIIKDLTSDKSKVTAQSIGANTKLTPSAQQQMLHLMDFISKRDGDTKIEKTYGSGFYDLFKRVHAPEGDLSRITDPSLLYSRVTKDGDLTIQGLDRLRAEISGRKTPEGVAESEMKKQFLANARAQISGSNEGLHLKDPKGDELYLKFLAQSLPLYDRARAEGKSAAALLNPDSPDYVGKGITQFKRPISQWTSDMLSSSGAAPADIKTPQGLVAAVQSGKMSRAEGEALALKNGWIRPNKPAAPEVSVPISR